MLLFNKSQRLLNSADFKAVRGTRLTVSSPQFLLLAKPNQLSHPRLGLAIAKKQVKLAVGRNQIKRVVREVFRHESNETPNIDIVVMVRRGVNGLDAKELHQCLELLWQQLVKRAHKCLSSS